MTPPPVTNFRQELKVLAILALFLLGLEIFASRIAPHLDRDRNHINQFDNILASLPENESGAILGNSLLMHGLDEDLLESQCELPLIHITPVNTNVLDWEHLYQRYFHPAKKKPDHLFLGFVAHHVNDSEPIKLRRLTRHFATRESLPSLWQNEDFNFHQRTQSILAHFIALIGDQPAHRERILDYFIDWYRLGLRTNQDFVSREPPPPATHSFQRFSRFIDHCQRDGIQVWLIPMPQPEFWEMDPDFIKLIEIEKLKLIDARNIPEMTPDDFSDGYHLGETGAEKFTLWLSQQINQALLPKNESRQGQSQLILPKE
jgi:hypothetical protein